jgi:hypothetical protein|tara:strand:+ start:503 stop:676 length:174 start_codon:yes stop_codon:yes gene_type:complete
MTRLIDDCREHGNGHLADMIDFTLETGLREGTSAELQHIQIDFNECTLTLSGELSKS